MKRAVLTALLPLALILNAEATPLPQGIFADPATGRILIDEKISMSLEHVSPGWLSQIMINGSSPLPDQKPGIETQDGIRFQGKFPVGAQTFDYAQSILNSGSDSVDCEWDVQNALGIKTEALFVVLKLPAAEYEGSHILIDGVPTILPPIPETWATLATFHGAKSIIIPVGGDKVIFSGAFDGQLVDSNAYEGPYYALRLYASPSSGPITQGRIHFKITKVKIAAEPVGMGSASNSSFSDDAEGDKHGGWTDQGRDKDLRSIQPGERTLNGVPFDVIDAAQNGGKSCIALQGKARPYFPESATLPLQGQSYQRLYLLHAAAWAAEGQIAGSLAVIYQDGTKDDFSVVVGRDVNDWTSGAFGDNCGVAWAGSNASGGAYLYTSSFPLQGKPLKKVVFSASKTGPVWLVAGVSGLQDQVTPPRPASKQTITYQANTEWQPIRWEPMAMAKGSALDFSSLQDAPIGKHGEVVCRGDNFYFQESPDRPLRFYGCNLSHSVPFVDKKRAEMLADFIAATGYNVVRFNCYLKWLSTDTGSPSLSPEGLDQFDYFLHCLGQRGVYYTFPLYGDTLTGYAIIQDPAIPEYSNRKITHELRGLAPISDPAMEYMREFSRNLLLHVNPYTGSAIKDDPALLSVEMLNEDSLHQVFTESPAMIQIYLRKCGEYLRQRDGREPSDEEVRRFLPTYLVQVQEKATRDFKGYLRGIGVDKPITDKSAEEFLSLAPAREQLDYVDNHAYWEDAEGVPTRLKLSNPNTGKWSTQIKQGAARLFGKPFSQGEYNLSYPSPYWAWMGPAESAIAGIQNWSMIIRFGIGPAPENVFTSYPATGIKFQNPMIMLSERIGSILFESDEVEASKVKIPYVVTRDYIEMHADGKGGGASYPKAYFSLGLACQIGTVVWKPGTDLTSYPCVVVPPDMDLPDGLKGIKHWPADAQLRENLRDLLPNLGENIFGSTSGQTLLNSEDQTLRIITSRAECLLLPPQMGSLDGHNVSISGNKTVSTCFVSSIDKRPIKESRHLLALYITDLKNTGTVVDYEKSSAVIQKMGDIPFLLRQGEVSFSVKTGQPGLPKIWALKYDGSRSAPIEPAKTADGFSFTARAITSGDTYFAYEIAW